MWSEVWARKEEVMNQEWGGVGWGPWAFGAGLILYISLLYMPCFAVWRVRQHPVHDGWLRSHGNVVARGEVSCVCYGQQRPRAVSLKESNYLQMAAELCSQILSVCVMSPLQGPSEGSSLWLCRLHFRPPGSETQERGRLAQQPEPTAEASLVWVPLAAL